MDYLRSHVVESEYNNEYKEYFQYIIQTCNICKPDSWYEALQLYNTILSCARNQLLNLCYIIIKKACQAVKNFLLAKENIFVCMLEFLPVAGSYFEL